MTEIGIGSEMTDTMMTDTEMIKEIEMIKDIEMINCTETDMMTDTETDTMTGMVEDLWEAMVATGVEEKSATGKQRWSAICQKLEEDMDETDIMAVFVGRGRTMLTTHGISTEIWKNI